ncbi:cation-transporting P-type ATPase [Pseudanabaena sp. FACHB-1998]|uniref:cation transporting ATPase C-terminal domain-containing protein n=1 Tax=Pseudanabaena sp. FACHB-1998 TaxID=2692858 RepID=UPI00168092E2|nr:cation transporting ATPase C-terminal domain-containing protein [Pseudanabaena sp. FACHB-1998]MBD2178803.1 cation-transporting P-type ATPase [Pseudanabaena sp. FACHB-1998]
MTKFEFLSDTQKPWHHMNVEEVLTALESSVEGLSYVNARQRLRHLGANKPPRSRPIGKIFLQPWLNPLTYLLLLVAIYLQANGAEGWALILVAILHGGSGLVISLWSMKTREKVSRDRPQRRQNEPSNSVMVLRDRDEMELPSRDLVLGDVLILKEGDRPNVDLRLIEVSEDFVVNQSNLGGEAICPKKADLTFEEKVSPLDCSNMVYAGTEVAAGNAKGIVVATGRFTQEQAAIIKEKPLSVIHAELRQLRRFWLGLSIFVTVVAIAFAWQRGIIINAMTAAALIVSTYPQNLLRIATQVQLLGMGDLARQRIWARFPSVLDALARVTTIVPILESDVVLSFDNLSRAGIEWRGLIRTSEEDAQAFGQVIGIETHSYFDAPQERIREWQGNRPKSTQAVAVIGNDVEDISLLRLADVGISDRTCRKELQDSSGLILPKEDFHYLPIAILEGRAIFDRLQRTAMLTASSSFTLATITLMDTAAGFSMPPLQLIWIGAIATPLVSLPLVFEPTHEILLAQPARRFQTILRSSNYLRILLAVIASVTAVAAVFWLKYQGQTAMFSQARSMAFVTLGFSQIFHACAIARQSIFHNLPLLIGISLIAVCQIIFVQLPWFGELMATVPLSGIEWAIAILSATAVFWVQELIKTS